MSERPRIDLIAPELRGPALQAIFAHKFPPLTLLTLAALARREGWSARIIDCQFDSIPTDPPDLVAITVWTPTAPEAYRIADRYRARGIPVLMGGVHASLLPDEALRHADAVLCGEAESIMPKLLRDAIEGKLTGIYHGEWGEFDDSPYVEEWADFYKTWPKFRYVPRNTYQTTRGCRFNCDFCSVIRINGRPSRHKPIDRVIDELRWFVRNGQDMKGFLRYMFFVDDDLVSDLDYAGELFEAMVAAKINLLWASQASVGVLANDELLDLASRSGCRALFCGFESPEAGTLTEVNKFNDPANYKGMVESAHRHGISIEGGFIFGADHETLSSFEKTASFAHEIEVDTAHFSVLTPYPGSHTFEKLHSAGRILSYDWSLYNLYNVVTQPEHMSPGELQTGLDRAYRIFYTRKNRLSRMARRIGNRDARMSLGVWMTGRGYYNNYHFKDEQYADIDLFGSRGFQPNKDDLERLAIASAGPAQNVIRTTVKQLSISGHKSA